jgi:ATP-dependent RNA circularization protein (DNA/RNA ligase family)
MNAPAKPPKPLGRKAYGSIPHLPGSRLGPGDHHCHPGQEAICTAKARDRHDRIIVTEKLDGGNVAIAKVDGRIWALGRAGYPAITSPFRQHHIFDEWVNAALGRWSAMLDEGEAVHGEWLAMAHGTKYDLAHEPFVVFDLTRNGQRVLYDELRDRAERYSVVLPHVISDGPPVAVEAALEALGPLGKHGALETVEGAVWRVERKGKLDFIAKYVRPDKQDGKYLSEITGCEPYWHWLPA